MENAKKKRTFLKEFRHKAENRLWEILSQGETNFLDIPATRYSFGRDRKLITLKSANCPIPEEWFKGVTQRLSHTKQHEVDNATLKSCWRLDYSKDLDQACHIVLTLWSAFKAHFSKVKWGDSEESLLLSVLYWLPNCSEKQDFIPFLKYQLAYLFAVGERQSELPVRPESLYMRDGIVLVGHIGEVFRYKCFGDGPSRIAWRNTVLHGIKKGLPQMGESKLAEAAVGMKKRLTNFASSPDKALDEIARTSKAIFGRIETSDWKTKAKPWTQLTGNACFEGSRSTGGAIGVFRREDEEEGCLGVPELHGMAYYPRTGSVKPVYFPSWTYEEIYEKRREQALSNLDQTGKAQVSLIREPLKARAISAGDIESNCLYADLQKALWSRMQRFPQLQLTGRWVSVEDISELESQTEYIRELTGVNLNNWVSGDYSAATDNLHGDATQTAARFAAGDDVTEKVLMRGLTNTEICFDNLRKQGIDAPENFVMTRGQLMGCVFSFPLLCTINLAMYRMALEIRTGRKFKISELPVRINGDDIVFKADDELYRIWSDVIKYVGFEKSVGKNYYSPNFCVINSVYFNTRNRVSYIPYLNLGWCTGVAKGSGGEEEKDLFKMRQQMDELEKYWKGYHHSDQIVREFKKQVFFWNEKRICSSHLPTDRGVWGLNLSDDERQFGIIDEFRWWLVSNDIPPTSHGLLEFPKTMAPWKTTTCENLARDYRELFTEFLRLRWSLDLNAELPFCPRSVSSEIREQRNVNKFKSVLELIRKEIKQGLTEYESAYATLGQLV